MVVVTLQDQKKAERRDNKEIARKHKIKIGYEGTIGKKERAVLLIMSLK